MFVINKSQMAAMGDLNFSRRMRQILNDAFPDSQEVPAEELEPIIIELVDQAAEYQLTLEPRLRLL